MDVPRPPPVDVSFSDLSYHIPETHTLASRLRVTDPEPSKQILHSISAYIGAAQSLAILGPSGSGKTTLLNLLAGRSDYPPSSGSVLFAGKPRVARTKRHIGYVMQDDVFFSKLTVKETLDFTASIRIPHLANTQRTRIVNSVLRKLRLLKCKDTIIGDQQFAKGISGGERKRLNIANELLHNPSLLLADECTSGLDSSSAYTVISLLRDLCLDGRTVITTIHQPSSKIFSLFDNILVLAAGHVAYFGSADRLVSYFESVGFAFPSHAYNPADFVLELVIDEVLPEDEDMDQPVELLQPSTQQRVIEAWKHHGASLLDDIVAQSRALAKKRTTPLSYVSLPITSSDSQSTDSADDSSSSDTKLPAMHDHPDAPSTMLARMGRSVVKRFHDLTLQHAKHNTPDKYPTNWFTQVRVLAVRALRQKRGNVIEPMYVVHVTLITIVVSLFWMRMEPIESTIEDRLGALSFVCIFFAFFSTFNSMFAFPSEKQVLNKDRASGAYRLSAYYFAKSMMETPVDMVTPIIFAMITYWAMGLNPKFIAFLLFTTILVLNVLVAQSAGLLVSALFMEVRKSQVMGSMWILTSMLISGYYIDPDNTPAIIKPLRFLSFIKYSYEAMVRTEMLPPRSFACAQDGEVSTIYSNGGVDCPIEKDALLRGAQLQDTLPIGWNIAVLLVWIVFLRFAGYFALKLFHTNHKPKRTGKQR